MKNFRDIPTSTRGIPLFKRAVIQSKPVRAGSGRLRFVGSSKQSDSLSSEDFVPARTWSFSTKPKFKRIPGKQEQNLLVERLMEPRMDIIDEIKDLVIIIELPGVKEEDMQWKAEGDILWVLAKTSDIKYYKEILLPFKVNPAGISASFKNEILEIKCFRKGGRG